MPNNNFSLGAGGVTLGGNLELIKRSFDEIATSTFYSPDSNPNYTTIYDEAVFHQGKAPYGVVNMFDIIGSGYWSNHAELQNVQENTPYTTEPVQFSSQLKSDAVQISWEAWNYAFGTGDGSSIRRMIEQYMRAGRATLERDGFGIYRNAALTNLADGVPMLSHVHPINGGTMDNFFTATTPGQLQTVDLETLIQELIKQPMKSGIPGMYVPRVLVVAPEDLPAAITLTESKAVIGPLNQQGNPATIQWVSYKYNIQVKSSVFLDSFGGLPTAYSRVAFLLSDAHKIFHWVAADLQTYFQNYTLSSNIAYKYIGFFHSIFGAFDGTGMVGLAI